MQTSHQSYLEPLFLPQGEPGHAHHSCQGGEPELPGTLSQCCCSAAGCLHVAALQSHLFARMPLSGVAWRRGLH